MSFLRNEIDTLLMIYHAHIHSHISFGLALYGATKKENLDEILKKSYQDNIQIKT
jgi:hypothetical protein